MTDNQRFYKARCLHLIEEKLGWGPSADWSNMDFQRLSDLIYEETKVLLSASTLKRMWGKVQYEGKPSPSTLNALAAFLGYENWRIFITRECQLPKPAKENLNKRGRWRIFFLLTGALLSLGLAYAFLYKTGSNSAAKPSSISENDFSFSSKPIADGIPNSVVFSYDASKAPADSFVYIQQNWDPTRRKQVPKEQHQFTSVYYEPGFFTAKLLIGNQVVKEHPLLIPSKGWLATIMKAPVPIYLKQDDYIKTDQLSIPTALIAQHKVDLMPQAPAVQYINVGNFKALKVNDFHFEASLKNNYSEGNNACQFSQVTLITDGAPILIPLAIKGCVSELNLMSVDQMISGKNTDLSAFGVDFSHWIKVSCRGNERSIQYFINDNLAYEAPLSSTDLSIVGMSFTFMGTGAVKGIKLKDTKTTVYQAF